MCLRGLGNNKEEPMINVSATKFVRSCPMLVLLYSTKIRKLFSIFQTGLLTMLILSPKVTLSNYWGINNCHVNHGYKKNVRSNQSTFRFMECVIFGHSLKKI